MESATGVFVEAPFHLDRVDVLGTRDDHGAAPWEGPAARSAANGTGEPARSSRGVRKRESHVVRSRAISIRGRSRSPTKDAVSGVVTLRRSDDVGQSPEEKAIAGDLDGGHESVVDPVVGRLEGGRSDGAGLADPWYGDR